MQTRLCLGGSFFKDVNTFRLQIMIHFISNNAGFLCFDQSFRNWFVCSVLGVGLGAVLSLLWALGYHSVLPCALCMLWTWTPINAGQLPAGLVGGEKAKEVVLCGTKICRLLAFCISSFLPAAESVFHAAEGVGVVWSMQHHCFTKKQRPQLQCRGRSWC